MAKDPTFFFHGTGTGSAGKKNPEPDPTPDPTLKRYEEKNIFRFEVGRHITR